MTAAYAAIANSGIYTEPLLYTEILDHDGNVLIDNSKPITRRVLKESTAFLLTSAMQDVINRGTGTPARLNNMPAAGKTGTTENSTDDESKDDENNEDNSTNNNSGNSENLGNTNGDDGDDVDPIPPTPDPEPNPEPEGPEVIPQSRN